MMQTIERFINYVLGFYGPEGIYAEFFTQSPVTELNVRDALLQLLNIRAVKGISFCADSFDREVIRDIMLVRKGICSVGETEYNTEL
jgi:hypothetical protein